MSAIVGREYIENLNHGSTQVKSIKATDFYAALGATYGEDITAAASKALLQQQDIFSGVKAFKERICAAILGNKEISVEDQKYIEDYVHRMALTSLSQARKQ